MADIGQYLKDTRAELRHVAWPTQTQTIIYTVLVALISIGVALYLGFFDFLFTTGLTRLVGILPQNGGVTVTQQPAASTTPLAPPSAGLVQGNGLTITPGTTTKQ